MKDECRHRRRWEGEARTDIAGTFDIPGNLWTVSGERFLEADGHPRETSQVGERAQDTGKQEGVVFKQRQASNLHNQEAPDGTVAKEEQGN